jgi:hypothetical protein
MQKISIYVGNVTEFESQGELYKAIRNSALNEKFRIVLCHDEVSKTIKSKEFLKVCEYMIAEVSHPTTGLGIELGWADLYGVKIICIYKTGSKISSSLKIITNNFIEYSNFEELIEKLEAKLSLI